jgi:outer membrane protein insertion porin family
MSGLYEGQKFKIPGDATADAIKKLWKTGFFDNVQLYLEKTVGNEAWLYFEVIEKPRLSKFSLKGVKKTEADDIREKIRLVKQKIVTEYLLANTKTLIKEFFVDKGYYNVNVEILSEVEKDSKNKDVILSAKIVTHLPKEQDVPLCFLIVDFKYNFSVISLYHANKSFV